MKRTKLCKTLAAALMRAAPGGAAIGDGPTALAGDALARARAAQPRGRGSLTTKAMWTGGGNYAGQASAPADTTLAPPLAGHSAHLEQLRAKGETRLQANGFALGRARQRSERKKAADDPAGPAVLLARAAAADSATDLASAAHPAAAANGAAAAYGAAPAYFAPPSTPESWPSAPATPAGGDSWAPAAPPPPAAAPKAAKPPKAPRAAAAAAAATSALEATSEDSDDDFDAGIPDEVVQEVYRNVPPPDVHVVNTAEGARAAAARLLAPDLAGRIFACDTEVADIDVSRHSPCCHGRVICFSVYAGPDVDFGGAGGGAVPRSMLWVDTYLDGEEGREGEIAAIQDAFRPFFAALDRPKVWHNYSFDRHVLERAGLPCAGFGGDTMHMARMWDSSRVGRGGYGLEALSSDADLMGADPEGGGVRGKVSMKKLFGKRNVKKDGTEGKLTVLPAVHELQRGPATRWQWVNYSAYDAKSTWDLHAALEARLRAEPAQLDAAVEADYARAGVHVASLWDVYTLFWRPFGELLTDMEAAGMAVDRPHLAAAEERAVREEADSKARFRSWAAARVPGAAYMNVGSGAQVLQLLFAGAPNKSAAKPALPLARTFKAPNQLPPPEDGKKPKKTMDVSLHSVWGPGVPSPLVPQVHTPAGIPACSTPVLKSLAGRPGRARKALAELEAAPAADDGLEALRDDWDEGGAAAPAWSTNDAEITRAQLEKQEASRIMARSELDAVAAAEGYGRLFSEFGTAAEGLRACAAVDALVDASAIDTLLSNFIVPLQSDAISKPDASGVHRVHCSLNINTETGRLSARRPNLQNQPALEKDRYRVRQAFTADAAAGNTLLVADYGQLELRILAHMAGCQSMITAFRLGGDFHSRTALGMYGHIQEAVASGACLLEWDGAGGEAAPAPLLKDLFGAERRRAKVLNFSIAYGKTAHGLSKDWGVSLKEAEETVRRWYNDRPEVKEWQARQHKAAEERGYVTTLLGRQRRLPDARSANKAVRSHALRAAINTPIQGSAADVATAAMVRINRDARLREMGWRLLLQVHDEVILEGPRESAAEAQARVVACMQSPFSGEGQPLLVDLAVDSKYADTWYDAK